MKSPFPARHVALVAVTLLTLGCGSSGPRKGSIGTTCSDDTQCDGGLACRFNVCVDPSKGGEQDVMVTQDTSVAEDQGQPDLTSEDLPQSQDTGADTGKEGSCTPNGTIECIAQTNAFHTCTNGEWSAPTYCNRVPCEALSGVPASGVRGGCVDGTGCGTTCEACPNFFAVDPASATCRTSCKDGTGADNDAYCWPLVSRCSSGVCVAVPKVKKGESCDQDVQCETGACVAAIKDGRFVPGLRVCCQAKCSDDPEGTCQGCLVGAGTCQTLNKRQRTDSKGSCEPICEDPQPDAGCQSGYDALAQSKIDAAHRIFIDRLRIDASDSTCNFGAALTTLLLSFEDTSNRFDACDHPELSHSLAPVLYELGGPLGLSLADRVFGPNGMLKQLNDARQLNQIGGLAKKTLLTVTRHYMNGQTPATENLPFSADYMVTTRDGFAIFDKTTRSVLRVTCPDGADQVKLGANMIADRGDVQNHNVAAPCFAEFRNKPGLFQSDEEQAQTSFMSRSDEIKTNLLSWTSYSVVNNAPAVGSIALTLYRRVFQGDWDTSEYIVIAGSLNDRTSDLNAILTSGIGELAGFISGEPPLIGRSPAFTFQFVADKLKAFVDGNLTAIINFLAAAGNDPQFSATIEPSMFFLPNDVDLRFDRADALLLLGALRGVRSLATYLYGFRWDFTFESDLDVRGLLCEKAITVLNPVFLKSKLDSPGLLTLLGGFRTGMLEAVQALRMAFETGKSLTTDAGPTHWQAINPDPASALDSLIGLTKALETELTSLAGTVLPMADDGNGNPISATFKSFFESPFVSTGTPPPFYCVTEQDKQETSTTMTDTFESAWLGSLFSPDVLTTQDLGLKLKYTASGESDPRDVDPFAVFQHFLETLEPLFSVFDVGN